MSWPQRCSRPTLESWKETLIRETILRNRRYADSRHRDDACFGAAAINHCRSLSGLGLNPITRVQPRAVKPAMA
jgi:hypothetical protein